MNFLIVKNIISLLISLILQLIIRKKSKGNNIIFINLGQIGDLVLSSIVLSNIAKLQEMYDDIYFIVRQEYIEIIKRYKNCNFIVINLSKYRYNLFYRIKFISSLRNNGYKVACNLNATRGSSVDELIRFCDASVSYCLYSSPVYIDRIIQKINNKIYTKILGSSNDSEYNKHILLLKEILEDDYQKNIYINIDQFYYKSIKKYIEINKINNFICISPFSDRSVKNWPTASFIELVKKITETLPFVYIFLIGNKNQYESNQSIVNSIDYKKENIINVAGKFSILESIELVRNSKLFIGNDSGFTHIAKAIGIKTIALIGGGSFNKFFPYTNMDENIFYFYHKKKCFGCEWDCIHDQPYCITKVQVDDVLYKIQNLLNENFRSN